MADLQSGKTFDCIYARSDVANPYACKPSSNLNKYVISVQNKWDVAKWDSKEKFLTLPSFGMIASGGNGWN